MGVADAESGGGVGTGPPTGGKDDDKAGGPAGIGGEPDGPPCC